MATADQIKALIRSHGAANDTRLYPVAMPLDAHAADSGQGKLPLGVSALAGVLRDPHIHPSRRPGDAKERVDPIWSHT